MPKIYNIIKVLRIKHYVKNCLIFFPLFFSGNFFSSKMFAATCLGFISFCFVSSCIYIINDLKDLEKDKLHPIKKYRPIAKGDISTKSAIVLLIMCFALSYIIVFLIYYVYKLSALVIIYVSVYFLLNVFYCTMLKNIPIIDIAILMSGFLIRILLGGAISNLPVSSWLYLTVMSGAFYFALGKRRGEIKHNENGNTRKVLKAYNYNFLDKFMYVSLAMTIVFFSLWSKEYPNPYVIWTVPIIVIICMQYSLDIETEYDGDPVEVVINDKKLLCLCGIFLAVLFIAIYII